ncbi:MAG: hypothetical protein M5U14_03400 [Acidimicrobiia bacterium]|nr:hypothetical protein [Acidimicrobiia bacterium]
MDDRRDAPATGRVRNCPDCGYLALGQREDCARCGATLEVVSGPSGAAPAAVAATSPAPAAPGGAAPSETMDAARAPGPHPIGGAALSAALSRPPHLGSGAPRPASAPGGSGGSGGYWAPARLGPSWPAPVERPVPAPRRRNPWLLLVFMAALCGGGWFALQRIAADPAVAEEVQEYADGTAGVPFESFEGRWRAVLPGEPVHRAETASEAGITITVSFDMVELGSDYAAGVAWADYPAGGDFSNTDAIFAAAAQGAANETGGEVVETQRVDHRGYPAVDVVVKAPEGYAKARAILAGYRMYIVIVASRDEATPGFDRLVESLELT